jgi:Phosphotransferase system, mannose/fructose-specific component IIA
MRGYLLVSHGFFAQELKESVKMIAGEVDHLEACCLEKTDGPESFSEKLKEAEQKLSDCEELIVFADMLGGSPCNTAFQYFQAKPNVNIIAGMNFPMLLTTLLTPDIPMNEIIAAGQLGVVDVRAFSAANSSDVDD